MKRVYAKEKVCINCKLCEIHCKKAHSKSKDLIKAFKFETPEPVARILVELSLIHISEPTRPY